jgi:hypothetical protein
MTETSSTRKNNNPDKVQRSISFEEAISPVSQEKNLKDGTISQTWHGTPNKKTRPSRVARSMKISCADVESDSYRTGLQITFSNAGSICEYKTTSALDPVQIKEARQQPSLT